MTLNVWLEKLGDNQIAKQRINDALQSYQKALALDSESLTIHQKISQVYTYLGQAQLAQKHQLKALMMQSKLDLEQPKLALEKSAVDNSIVYNYRIKSPQLKLLYFEIPKNASSTIKTILFSLEDKFVYDQTYIKYMWFKKWQKKFPNMIVSWQEISTLPYLKVAFVRNPYERVLSGYLNTAWNFNHQNISFEAFVDTLVERIETPASDLFNNHYKPFSYFVPKQDSRYFVDFIGKVENLETDLKTIFYACNLKTNFKIPVINKSKSCDYKSYYNTKIQHKVAQIYAEDIELGKYLF